MQRISVSEPSFFGKCLISFFSNRASSQDKLRETLRLIERAKQNYMYISPNEEEGANPSKFILNTALVILLISSMHGEKRKRAFTSLSLALMGLAIDLVLAYSCAIRELEQNVRLKLGYPEYESPVEHVLQPK